MSNSQAEVNQFIADNSGRIAAIRGRLVEQGRAFIEHFGHLLPERALANSKSLLQARAPESFGLVLRQHASAFAASNRSDGYWPLVDACLFVGDASNDCWQHLTLDGRSQYLKFAEDLLNENPIPGPAPRGVIAPQEMCDA